MLNDWIESARRLRMPPLGYRDTYFLGSGRVGASGDDRGEWTFAIGPELTSPNYIKSESIELIREGEKLDPRFDVRRVRGKGAFFSGSTAAELRLSLTECTVPESSELLRCLTVENDSDAAAQAEVAVCVTPAYPAVANGDSVTITAPKGAWCFGNAETKNWADRKLRIRMSGASVTEKDGVYSLRLKKELQPDETWVIPIWHEFAFGDFASHIEDAEGYITLAAEGWSSLLGRGKVPFCLPAGRARDVVESLLTNILMQQNTDGGMIAGIRKYANSYVRDTHGGMRMLTACGQTERVEKLLNNIHTRWERKGFIPNWWSMGSDTFIGDSFSGQAAEITAYYIFMARDYLLYGGREETVKNIMPSLTWAADAQTAYLNAHEGLMCFNGDETEQYCTYRDGDEYGLWHRGASDRLGFDRNLYSYTATAAAAVSLEWMSSRTGKTEYAQAASLARQALGRAFWNEKKGCHYWIAGGREENDSELTNYLLMPVWFDRNDAGEREKSDVLRALRYFDAETGMLPLCPGRVDGTCGHTLAYALYAAAKLALPEADELFEAILSGPLLGEYGTVCEFYGPAGTPNGHNARPFEGGILGDALIEYLKTREKAK